MSVPLFSHEFHALLAQQITRAILKMRNFQNSEFRMNPGESSVDLIAAMRCLDCSP